MGIDGVIFDANVDGHNNDVREIQVPFNYDIKDFIPRALRIITIKTNKEIELGNHWRECNEVLYHVNGPKVQVFLAPIDENYSVCYNFRKGNRLFIPKNIALRVKGINGLELLSMIDRKYEPNAEWDHKLVNPDDFWNDRSTEYFF